VNRAGTVRHPIAVFVLAVLAVGGAGVEIQAMRPVDGRAS
jgi:hypothetical protein